MNIKNLKPKAKESTFIFSLDGKATTEAVAFVIKHLECKELIWE